MNIIFSVEETTIHTINFIFNKLTQTPILDLLKANPFWLGNDSQNLKSTITCHQVSLKNHPCTNMQG